MDITDETDEKCIKAYFHLLRLLAVADRTLRLNRQVGFDLGKALSLFPIVEAEFARRGYRTLLTACGDLVDAQVSKESIDKLLHRREEGETTVYYAARTRSRIERLLLEMATVSSVRADTTSTASS